MATAPGSSQARRSPPRSRTDAGVEIDVDDVTVLAAGRVVLDRMSVHIAPGEHVAIVGVSGAGKSTLVGLLLGWHTPASGHVRVDGMTLDAERLVRLRREIAWIDPQVHLFRATLFDNLCYGNGAGATARIGPAVEAAGLVDVLHRLSDGLQTPLGEGGGIVSGGEGQRVRFGRAMARPGARLAILDEPARGLEREDRRKLLIAARRQFRGATVLAITHDVGQTLDFDRVVVIENGRCVAEGPPRVLQTQRGSRYLELIDREREVHERLWGHERWRRLNMSDGRIFETVRKPVWTLV